MENKQTTSTNGQSNSDPLFEDPDEYDGLDELLDDELDDEESDSDPGQNDKQTVQANSEQTVESTKDDAEPSDDIPAEQNSSGQSLKSTLSGPPKIQLTRDSQADAVSIEPAYEASVSAKKIEQKFASLLGTRASDRAFELIYRLLDFTEYIDGLNRREMVINRMLAQLDEMNINSVVEATQAVQMLVADQIQQDMAWKGMLAENTELKEFHFKWSEKFMKQTNKKMESLQDLREDAEQTIRVEQVDVSDGGQAMVGNFRKNDQGEGE